MSKLVATYAEGFFAVFTESRSGMQQRALIDIGGKVPTPKEMAELAGTLSDHWGWANAVGNSSQSTHKAIAKPAPKDKRAYVSPKESGEPVGEQRNQMILDYLANHPKSPAKEIISGLGWEPTVARMSRWHHAFKALVTANAIVYEIAKQSNANGRMHVYSLPK